MRHTRTLAVALVAIALSTAADAKTTPAKTRRTPRAQTVPAMAVPFIDDDYARAVAAARAQRVPIFVEAWAPW